MVFTPLLNGYPIFLYPLISISWNKVGLTTFFHSPILAFFLCFAYIVLLEYEFWDSFEKFAYGSEPIDRALRNRVRPSKKPPNIKLSLLSEQSSDALSSDR